MIKNSKIKAEESFSISKQGYTMEKLLGGTECQLLLDTGSSISLMSNNTIYAVSDFILCPNFH